MANEVNTPEHSLFFRKDTKRWVLTVPVDGKDWKGKRRQRVAPADVRTKAQANDWAESALAALASGEVTLPGRVGMPVREMVERALRLREGHPDVKPGTLTNNKTHAKTHILTEFGALGVAQVGTPEARAFVRKLRASCSPNHTRNIFSTARVLWDIARAEGWSRVANPFREPQVVSELPAGRTVRTKSGKPFAFPVAIAQRLVDHEDIPAIRRVKYLLAVTSGERDGELCGLRFSDVYLDAPVPLVRVEQALALRGPEGHATVSTPKTEDSKRPIPLHPATIEAITWWKEIGWEMYVTRKPKPDDFLFPRPNGTPQRPRSAEIIRADVGLIQAEDISAGIEPSFDLAEADFHATRRTFSSALKAAKVPEDVRAKLMGHRGKTVAARHYDEEDLAEMAEAVARIPITWSPPPEPGVQDVGGSHTRRPLQSKPPLRGVDMMGHGHGKARDGSNECTLADDFLNRWSAVQVGPGAHRIVTDPPVWCAGQFGVRTPNDTLQEITADPETGPRCKACGRSCGCDPAARFRALSHARLTRAA